MPKIPTEDLEFNSYINEAVPYLDTNKVRLGVTVPNITQLNGYLTDWNLKFPLTQSDETCTTPLTKQKNLLRKQIETLLRKICADIPESALTIDDRTVIKMKKRDSNPTPAPVPVTIPGIDLKVGNGVQIVIRYRILSGEPGYTSNRKKPKHIKCMEFCYKIGDPAPVNANDCNLRVLISKIPYYLEIDPVNSGKILRGYGRWINTRNIPGIWSFIVSIRIP